MTSLVLNNQALTKYEISQWKITSINRATFFIIFLFFSLAETLVCSLESSSETFLSAISHRNSGSSTNTSENNWKTKA